MIRRLTAREIEAVASALIVAEETNLGVEVTTPVVYPGGQPVTVVVAQDGEEYVVHDAGFGAMFLTGSGVRLTKQIRKKLAALAANYGCEFLDGRMRRRSTSDDVPLAIAMVANSSRCVGDELLEVRRRTESEFVAAVSDSLKEVFGGQRIRTNEQFAGESGAQYRIHNVVLDRGESSAIAFVEPLTSRAVVSQRFMEFSDLKPLHQSAHMYVVADDHEVLSPPHERLLRKVCQVVPYSQSREIFEPLAA